MLAARPTDTHSMSGDGTGERLLLTALTSTMVLLVLDSSIVGVMLPSIERDLHMSASQSSWVVSVYLLTLAIFLPVGGRLADAWGAVRGFRLGMAGFVAASTAIALAPDVETVIAARAVAGISGALLMPATLSLLTSGIAKARRAGAMAVYTGVGQGFALVGPAVGGLCAQFIGWRWGFLVNVPVGLAGMYLIHLAAPRNLRTPVQTWDVRGMALLSVGLGMLATALIELPDWGWQSTAFAVTVCAGSIVLAAFVMLARRTSEPILDIGLFRRTTFATNTIVLAAVGFAMTVASVYGAVALQNSLHLRPAAAGLSLLPLVIPLLVATKLIGARYERFGLRRVVVGGSVILAVGLCVAAAGFATASLVVVSIGMVCAGTGMGAILSPLSAATIATVPDDRSGQASGVMTTCRQLGGVLGLGVFAAVVGTGHGDAATAVGFALTAGVMVLAAVIAAVGLPRCGSQQHSPIQGVRCQSL